LKEELIRAVIVRRNRLGITVDHHRFKAHFAQGITRMTSRWSNSNLDHTLGPAERIMNEGALVVTAYRVVSAYRREKSCPA
jgi:hypothetical protein